MTIRAATPADAAALADLGARTFRDTYAADTSPEDLDAFVDASFRPELVAEGLAAPSHRYLIAESGGRAAGFALLRDDVREPGVPGERPLQLAQLYVDRRFQGTGLGKALLFQALDHARSREHDVLWLGVWERNARAVAFYERWGFEHVGEAPFEFGAELHRDLLLALRL